MQQIYKKYLGDWCKVIGEEELNTALSLLTPEYLIKQISPKQQDVFKAFNLCDYNDLKVVMLGQDPYPQANVATGILFGNREDTKHISPSLAILADALLCNEINPYRFDITLESWAKQGVLMLNSSLTVEVNKVGSHYKIWQPFIATLLKNLSEINSGIIYVLFGNQAQSFKKYIGQNNYILEYIHPAAVLYSPVPVKWKCDAFDKINEILKANNNLKIDWYETY